MSFERPEEYNPFADDDNDDNSTDWLNGFNVTDYFDFNVTDFYSTDLDMDDSTDSAEENANLVSELCPRVIPCDFTIPYDYCGQFTVTECDDPTWNYTWTGNVTFYACYQICVPSDDILDKVDV